LMSVHIENQTYFPSPNFKQFKRKRVLPLAFRDFLHQSQELYLDLCQKEVICPKLSQKIRQTSKKQEK